MNAPDKNPGAPDEVQGFVMTYQIVIGRAYEGFDLPGLAVVIDEPHYREDGGNKIPFLPYPGLDGPEEPAS